MAVAGGNAIEFLEDFFQILFFHPYAVVVDGDFDTLVAVRCEVACGDAEPKGDILAAIFYCIVEQVKYHVGEVHLVNIDG